MGSNTQQCGGGGALKQHNTACSHCGSLWCNLTMFNIPEGQMVFGPALQKKDHTHNAICILGSNN